MKFSGAEWHTPEGRRAVLAWVAARLNEAAGRARFVVEAGGLASLPSPLIRDVETNLGLNVEPNWVSYRTYTESPTTPYLIHTRCNRHYKLRHNGTFNVEKVLAACNSVKEVYT